MSEMTTDRFLLMWSPPPQNVNSWRMHRRWHIWDRHERRWHMEHLTKDEAELNVEFLNTTLFNAYPASITGGRSPLSRLRLTHSNSSAANDIEGEGS